MNNALLIALLALAVSARAQDGAPAAAPAEEAAAASPAAPAAEAAPAAAETRVEEAPAPAAAKPAPEAKAEEPKAAAKAEPEPAPVAKAAPAPAASKASAPEPKAAVSSAGAAEEWAFAKSAAEDADPAVQEAALEELRLFVRRRPDSPDAPEAMRLEASLQQKSGDWQPAAATLLALLYEYPGTKTGLKAKSAFLELVDKKASRKARAALVDFVNLPSAAGKDERLAALWSKVADKAPDAIYEPAAAGIRDFFARFPNYPGSDRLQASLARLHTANGKPQAAVLAWRRLLAIYPDSDLRAAAQLSIGDLYAEAMRDPKRAIDAYQDLIERFPQAPEVQSAFERSAKLFEEKLAQPGLAVEMHERIVTGFPKTPASLAALRAIARLQSEKLAKPDEAVKTLLRLSQMHGGQEGVDALLQAADLARRGLKDMSRQAELLRQLSVDYATSKEAPQALYDAADVYESDLKDLPKAIEAYKEVASRFASSKLARKAASRAVKLEAVRPS